VWRRISQLNVMAAALMAAAVSCISASIFAGQLAVKRNMAATAAYRRPQRGSVSIMAQRCLWRNISAPVAG